MKWILCIAMLFPMVASARERDLHGLLAVSTNFSFPGSIRIGWSNWEIGRLTPFSYGFNKIFDFSEYTYATFGFGYSSNVGLYGGVGAVYRFFGFGVRGELTTFYDANGFSQGLGILGVTYGF